MTNNVGAHVKQMTVVVLAIALAVVLAAALGAGFLGAGFLGQAKSASAQTQSSLAISKAVFPSPTNAIPVGTQMDFLITEENTTDSPFENVIVTDQLPAGISNVSATPSQGQCSVFEDQGEVVCRVGTIPAQGVVHINIVSTATTPGTYTNTGVDMLNNRAGANFTVVPAS